MALFVSIGVLVLISITSCQGVPEAIAPGADGTIAGSVVDDMCPETCSSCATQPSCQPNVQTEQTDSTVQILAELLNYVLRQESNGSSPCSGAG